MLEKVDLGKGEIVWSCGGCSEDRTARITDLQAGHEHGDADAIVLPLCTCGSQTLLFRRWDNEADLPHRRAINSLVEHLIAAGQSHPAARAKHDAEEDVPPLMVDLSSPIEDLTGRKRFAEEQAERAAAAAAWEAARPEREAVAAALAAATEAAEIERLFQVAEARRLARARANVVKRLGLPPGAEAPPEELAAELAKNASEIAPPPPEQLTLPIAADPIPSEAEAA